MYRSTARIASPVNRTPSFEIAITTSPPLSPGHQSESVIAPALPPVPPPHLYSPRRNVQETIMREVREYHVSSSHRSSISPKIIVAAPIAEPESTSSLRTTPEQQDQDDDIETSDATSPNPNPNPIPTTTRDDDEIIEERNVDDAAEASNREAPRNTQISQQIGPSFERPIVFPITPFYRRKGGCSKFSLWIGALCAFFFLLSIALFLVWIITTDGFRTIGSKANHVCNTRSCIDIAFRLSSNIEETIEPCDNFYQHSCQRFHTQTNDKQLSFLSQLKENSLKTVQNLLSSEKNVPEDLSRSGRLAKSLYEICMNAVQRSINAPNDLQQFVRNFPCAPLLRDCQNFQSDSYSWERHAGMLDWYAGAYNLIVYDRDVHPQDRSKIVLQIKPPNLNAIIQPILENLLNLANPSSTEFEPLLQLSLRQNFLSGFVREYFQRDPRDVQTQLDDVARLFVELYQATKMSSLLSPLNSNSSQFMTIQQLTQSLPQLFFRQFFDADLSKIYKWSDDDVISVQNFDYFAKLIDIMATTQRQTVANYLLIITIYNLKQFSYSSTDQFGWRECVDQISTLEITKKLYVENAENIDLGKINEFLTTLKTDFISTHRSTPLQYLSTINRLGFFVGYPQRMLNEEIIWRPLSQISLNSSDYFDSFIRVAKAENDYQLSQIGTYLDSDDTIEFPITNPTMIFNSHVGAVTIPLSFLDQPINILMDGVPMYSIYSSLGVTVTQMISKVFWQGLDKSAQLQCFNNIYRGFLDSNRQRQANIDPQLLSTIELADAFKTSVYSYSKWQNDHNIHHEKTLPAFDSTDNMQTMMLTFSTLFCSGEGSEPGSDYEAMINTVAANSKMFSIHFKCTNSTRLFNRQTCL